MDRSELEIPNPCPFERDEMRPIAASLRFCPQCQRHVHELSTMSEAAARALLAREGQICVSYATREDGTIAFDLPVIPSARLRRDKRRPELDAVIRVAAAASLAAMLAACTVHQPAVEPSASPEPMLVSEREPRAAVPEPAPCDPALADDDERVDSTHKRRPTPSTPMMTAGAPRLP